MSEFDTPNTEIKKMSKEFLFSVVKHSVHIEDVMTTIICLELSKDWLKTKNFTDYYDNVSFENKINLSEIILKSNHPNILKKFPKIFLEIREIKKLRNSLAHNDRYYLASVDGSEHKFVLHPRKIGKQMEFTKSEMIKQTKKAEKCLKDVWKVQDLFAKDFGYSQII